MAMHCEPAELQINEKKQVQHGLGYIAIASLGTKLLVNGT